MNHVPNILTVLRVILTLVFLNFITKSDLTSVLFASVIFSIASATDYLDGYLAKKYELISDFGKIMDPIADKFLVLAAFFAFWQVNIIAAWMFLLIFLREVAVTVSRLVAMRQGRVLAAEKAGKIKTVSQIIAISVILIFMILKRSNYAVQWVDAFSGGWAAVIHALMIIAVGLTLYSGYSYFQSNRKATYA